MLYTVWPPFENTLIVFSRALNVFFRSFPCGERAFHPLLFIPHAPVTTGELGYPVIAFLLYEFHNFSFRGGRLPPSFVIITPFMVYVNTIFGVAQYTGTWLPKESRYSAKSSEISSSIASQSCRHGQDAQPTSRITSRAMCMGLYPSYMS